MLFGKLLCGVSLWFYKILILLKKWFAMHILLRHISFLFFEIHFVILKEMCTSPNNRLSVASDCEPADRQSYCETIYERRLNSAILFFSCLCLNSQNKKKRLSSNMNH